MSRGNRPGRVVLLSHTHIHSLVVSPSRYADLDLVHCYLAHIYSDASIFVVHAQNSLLPLQRVELGWT